MCMRVATHATAASSAPTEANLFKSARKIEYTHTHTRARAYVSQIALLARDNKAAADHRGCNITFNKMISAMQK